MMTENTELLRRYLAERSETAFTELVQRNIDLVYSAALRQVGGDAATAQEVTLSVFTDLARKAPALLRHSSLTGWLYTSTRYLAATARRSEQRRRARELQAHAMHELLQASLSDPSWDDLRPVLDDAMHELSTADREAVLMRYFEGRPLAEIGVRFGLTENAARMRVERAVEKLRAFLVKRGITSTTAAVAMILTQRAVSAAPAGMAAQVGRDAFEAGIASGGVLAGLMSWLALWKGAWLAGGTALALLAAAGFVFWAGQPSPRTAAPPSPVVSAPASPGAGASSVPELSRSDAGVMAEAAPGVQSSDQLVLRVVAADSGKAIPNVEFDHWVWGGNQVNHSTPLRASRAGICVVPVARERVTHLILVSRSEGFADTRLEWRTERGERIPEEYTLRLARSVPLGGSVVDPEGKPVSGAEISFGNRTDAAQEGTAPQTDNFGWPFHVTATSDAAGRWHIDRISADALPTIEGRARHPDYVASDTVSVQRSKEVEKQLKERSIVFRLKPAVVVRGVVVDPDGQPVGDAHVLVGHRGETNSREASTGPDGTFSVAGCRPGPSPLTADAQGFAATTIEVELNTNSEPYRLTLQPARTLRLRVINVAGQPIAGASIWLDTFQQVRGSASSHAKEAAVPQVEFQGKTDAEGKVLWDSAPDQELSFDIAATGYMRKNDVQARPDGQEHAVTLAPALTIAGTVRDASNGQPIPRFRIITGWPNPGPHDGQTSFQWSSIDRFWLNFEGGKFRHVYEEPVIAGSKPYGFAFKFEAEGYASAITRAVAEDEGKVHFDIALQPARTSLITVVLPDGRPAASADIGLVSPSSGLRLLPGGFDRNNVQSGGSLVRTDGRGEFKLPPDESIARIIAAHLEGFAETTPAALESEPTLRLQPWGRLEGIYRSAGQAAAGRELLFEYGDGNYQSISSSFDGYRVKTDAQGRFVVPQVPPGHHRLVRLVETKVNPGGVGWTHEPMTDVEIRAGETTSIAVGGCTVTARLRWPADLSQVSNWTVRVWLRPASLIPPDETKANPAALAAWYAQPETRKAAARTRGYALSQKASGVYAAEEVPAGDYQLAASVLDPSTSSSALQARAHAELLIAVPADLSAGSLDLGEIELQTGP
jgi:RNA polymerase sigma factor (sigma-70 family)